MDVNLGECWIVGCHRPAVDTILFSDGKEAPYCAGHHALVMDFQRAAKCPVCGKNHGPKVEHK